jgi:hypothetical protein
MAARQNQPLYYFTIEDESILAEAFSQLPQEESFAISYKVTETEDVFVTTAETRDAMDRHDVPYTLLAEEDANRIALYHSALSKEELADYEDALKALALARRGIAAACVGVNGDANLGFDIGETGTKPFTYFTAPAGHTFIWRVFQERSEADEFLKKLTLGDRDAQAWVESIPLESSKELVGFH